MSMAKKTVAKYFSDISGKEITDASPTVRFAFGGVNYEVDLTADERAEFEAALSTYIDAGRRARTGSRRNGGPAPADVRAWANEQGMKVPARGRIPGTILEAYSAAH